MAKIKVRLRCFLLFMMCSGSMFGQTAGVNEEEVCDADCIVSRLRNFESFTCRDFFHFIKFDTTEIPADKKEVYVDTTILLNDTIMYSIIRLPDKYAICSYLYILSVDVSKKSGIAFEYLLPMCDIDYSQPSYQLYACKFVFKDTVEVAEETVNRKRDKEPDEVLSVRKRDVKSTYIFVLPNGIVGRKELGSTKKR